MSHRAADFGFTFDKLSFDWSKVIKRSRAVADKLAGGVEFLFKKNKIDYIRGEGTIEKAGEREREKRGWEGGVAFGAEDPGVHGRGSRASCRDSRLITRRWWGATMR